MILLPPKTGNPELDSYLYSINISYNELIDAIRLLDGSITSNKLAPQDYIDFNMTPPGTIGQQPGRLLWDSAEKTLGIGTETATVLQVGQETVLLVRNDTASEIPDGTVLMFTGTLGASGRIKVAPMIADGSLPSYVIVGVATEQIPANSDGFCTVFGKIRGINTSAYTAGSVLWCNPAIPGGLTMVQPIAPSLKLPIAVAINSTNNGTLFVRINPGSSLDDLHDIEANGAKVNGDMLAYNSTNLRWELKKAGVQATRLVSTNYTVVLTNHVYPRLPALCTRYYLQMYQVHA